MKYIVHAGTGTVIWIGECVVVDSEELDEVGIDVESPEASEYGKPVGQSCRETIPCSNCGLDVWDDDDNAHVATGMYNCEEN